MRVAVTGATGFTGGHTLVALREHGHEPRALVRDHAKLTAVEELHGLEPVDHVVGDVTDRRAIEALLDGVDAVVHTAAVAFIGRRHQAAIESTNAPAARLVLGLATERGLDPIVHLSSTSALHSPPGGRYEAFGPITDQPLGAYAASKAESEREARRLQDEGHPVVILWPSGITGPDDVAVSVTAEGTAKILSSGALPVLPTGGSLFHDVRDLAQVIARVIEPGRGPRGYGVFGHFLPWREMADLVEEVSGTKLRKPKVPAWLMRGLGRGGDLVDRFGRTPPLDTPTVEFMLGLVDGDDRATRDELDIEWRPAEQTFADMLRWLVEAGHLDAARAPALAG